MSAILEKQLLWNELFSICVSMCYDVCACVCLSDYSDTNNLI